MVGRGGWTHTDSTPSGSNPHRESHPALKILRHDGRSREVQKAKPEPHHHALAEENLPVDVPDAGQEHAEDGEKRSKPQEDLEMPGVEDGADGEGKQEHEARLDGADPGDAGGRRLRAEQVQFVESLESAVGIHQAP